MSALFRKQKKNKKKTKKHDFFLKKQKNIQLMQLFFNMYLTEFKLRGDRNQLHSMRSFPPSRWLLLRWRKNALWLDSALRRPFISLSWLTYWAALSTSRPSCSPLRQQLTPRLLRPPPPHLPKLSSFLDAARHCRSKLVRVSVADMKIFALFIWLVSLSF